MGRHTDRAVQLSVECGTDDIDFTVPAILDDLEDALLDNFDKAIKSIVKNLNSIHPLHRLYLADQLVSTLFADSEFEYYCSKIALELQTVKENAFKSLEKEGLSDLQLDILIDKIPHSVWQKLSISSYGLKINWQGSATDLSLLIKELIASGKINPLQIPRSSVCTLFASIFNSKYGKPIKPDTLDDYIVQFNNGDKEVPPIITT